MTEQFADQIGERIEAAIAADSVDARLLGPVEAPIAKLQDKYRFHMLVTGTAIDVMRVVVNSATDGIKPPGEVQWIVDVDPLDML